LPNEVAWFDIPPPSQFIMSACGMLPVGDGAIAGGIGPGPGGIIAGGIGFGIVGVSPKGKPIAGGAPVRSPSVVDDIAGVTGSFGINGIAPVGANEASLEIGGGFVFNMPDGGWPNTGGRLLGAIEYSLAPG
jgi:hypothetical protein